MYTFLDQNKIFSPEIHFAPLQGFTDMAYYSAFSCCFNSVDFYYTPYFSVDDDLSGKIKNIPEHLLDKLTAQILTKDIEELKLLLAFVVRNGFKRINLNLGCPYPMVTRKGRGAALIQSGNKVAGLIDYILENSSLEVSIKTRLGLTDKNEIFNLLDAISYKNIKSVIIHPRTASQLYKGEVSTELFQKCKELYPSFDFIYNGDISNKDNFRKISTLFYNQQKWMIGRGLLSNPFLAGVLKDYDYGNSDEHKKLLRKFVFTLMAEIESDSKNNGHALNRIKTQLYYLSNAFCDPQRITRVSRKIKSISELEVFLDNELSKESI